MFQLFLLFISFMYGVLVGFFSFLIKSKCWKVILLLVMTLIYLILFYILNNGEIHLYNKIMLIIGYVSYYLFGVKLNVKLKKNTRKI